jgi:hypothetical protein
MHQQYLVRITSGTTSDTPGAAPREQVESDPIEAKPGTFARLAREIATADPPINVRSAGGHAIETGGEVVIAVSDEDEPRLGELLRAKGYRFRVIEPYHDYLEDRPGALADFLETIASDGRLVESINVGTPDEKGTIPVQARTIRVA